MILKKGIITNKELADWFGVKESTLKNSKKKRLEELKKYAKFEEIKGKVNILEVYEEIYIKRKSKSYQTVRNNFEKTWSENGLDLTSRVANQIYNEHKEEIEVSQRTNYIYTLDVKTELYGSAKKKTKGSKGISYYVWSKRHSKDEKPIPLNAEETAILREAQDKYFKREIGEDFLLYYGQFNRGEITKEEMCDSFLEAYNFKGNYLAFKREVEAAIGAELIPATQLEDLLLEK